MATANALLALVPLLPVGYLLAPMIDVELMAYVLVAVGGFVATDRLIPNIQQYTLRKGISGKDLGKRGTALEDKPV